MDRRDFLRRLLSAGVIAVADPEKLLWMPGERVHFVITRPLNLTGIPYHHSDASTASWCGLHRASPESIAMIKEMARKIIDNGIKEYNRTQPLEYQHSWKGLNDK